MVKKILDQLSRYIVGILFIFSGLIKLNDPIGTQIKLEEYFEVFAADFGSVFLYFIPYALEIGIALIVLEISLGVAVLVYYRMQTMTVILLGLIVFFTFLTFYSAYFNKVTDCGCFGDAIKLTPWESFIKDIVLFVFVLHLFWYRKSYRPALRTLEGHTLMGLVTILSFIIGYYAIAHLPYLDFRPYKVGLHIPTQMIPEEQPEIEYVFEKDGEEVRSVKYLPENEGFTYRSSRVLNEDKITPRITDYAVTDTEGNDVTQLTFEGTKLLLIVADASKASPDDMEDLRALITQLEGQVEVMLLTSSGGPAADAFRHEHQLAVPYFFADMTVLKTIIRSNPGITLWKDGTVMGKWHHNDTPSGSEVMSLL